MDYARGIEERSSRIAAILRRCTMEQPVLALLPEDVTWDAPHRLLAAVQWLTLSGEAGPFLEADDGWQAFHAAIEQHGDRIAGFVREQGIQTNEVQRCFVLLPAFLTVSRIAGRPLDLIELGAAAGLNLCWDRYRYRYQAGAWGPTDAALALTGTEGTPVPAELLAGQVVVRRRQGIDLQPVDIRSQAGLRLLESFLLDDRIRVERLRAAARIVRRDPPEIIEGDYVDLLPELLLSRGDDAQTVIYQKLSSIYLPDDRLARLLEVIDEAGADGPLAWISTPTPPEHGERRGDYPVELTIWPGPQSRTVARMNVTGDRLEWLG
jgi:hypothetical protein